MILSDFPMFVGVKWLKFDCKVTTKTTYTETIPMELKLNINHPANEPTYSYSDYYFTTDSGFSGGTNIRHENGRNMYGYHVTDTNVYIYENDKVDSGTGWITYNCRNVAHADKTVTTIYSKGDTIYAPIYIDDNELPESGQLIEGSANDSYCVIKVDGTIYYYEKEN
jgi:hypothetical protein